MVIETPTGREIITGGIWIVIKAVGFVLFFIIMFALIKYYKPKNKTNQDVR